MGGILHAAGITGFLGNQDRQRRGNEEAAGFGYLLGELHRLSKGAPFTVNDVYDRVVANNAQLEGVVDPGGRKLSEHGMHIALGRYLAAHTDQIAGGLKLTSLAVLAREGTKQYQVRPMPKPKGATHG